MIVYDRVAKNVGPKKAALKEAEDSLKAAIEALATKKSELKAVMDILEELEENLTKSKQKQQELIEQAEDCKTKLAHAEKLIGGLGGERSRWEVFSKELGED